MSRDEAAKDLRRLYACAFLADGAFYLLFTTVPWKALRLGASPLALGILPAVASGIYIFSSLGFGRLSDRWPRIHLVRAGLAILTLVVVGILLAPSVKAMAAVLAFLGLGMGMYWPAVQAAIAGAGPHKGLEGRIGRFNMSWSSGKMTGFLIGGALFHRLGEAATLGLALVFLAALLVLIPRSLAGPGRPSVLDEVAPVPPEVRRRFRRAAWILNFIAFGTGATLNHQYPKLLSATGRTAEDFGLFLGTLYLTHTAVFWVLSRRDRWAYRWKWLLGSQLLLAAALAALPWLDRTALVLCAAVVMGGGIGVAYASSLYYSLHFEKSQGRFSGVHESLIGSGTFLFPLVGGWATAASGKLWTPYLVCALASAAAVGSFLPLRRRSPAD